MVFFRQLWIDIIRKAVFCFHCSLVVRQQRIVLVCDQRSFLIFSRVGFGETVSPPSSFETCLQIAGTKPSFIARRVLCSHATKSNPSIYLYQYYPNCVSQLHGCKKTAEGFEACKSLYAEYY